MGGWLGCTGSLFDDSAHMETVIGIAVCFREGAVTGFCHVTAEESAQTEARCDARWKSFLEHHLCELWTAMSTREE